jgi:hypothetical protein
MSSRVLLSATLSAPLVRRHRRDNGRPISVATVRDTDRGEPRIWTVFANDPDILAKFETPKSGEPIAIAGPFTVTVERGRLVHKLSADSIVTARKGRTKRKDNPLLAVDPNEAPKDDDDNNGRPLDDPLLF